MRLDDLQGEGGGDGGVEGVAAALRGCPCRPPVAIQWVEATTPKVPTISGRVVKGLGLIRFKLKGRLSCTRMTRGDLRPDAARPARGRTVSGSRIQAGISGKMPRRPAVSFWPASTASRRSMASARSPEPERISPTSWPSLGSTCRARAARLRPDRKQALPDQAAVLGAGRQLLAHVAALLPVDAVQLVEAAFQQQRLLDGEVAAAVGHAEFEAQRVVGSKPALRCSRARRAGPACPPARARARRARAGADRRYDRCAPAPAALFRIAARRRRRLPSWRSDPRRSPWSAACRGRASWPAPARARARFRAASVSTPPSTTNMSLRKRPCGVSSAAQIAWSGATLVVSLEISPCRNSTRSAPPTAMTPRWGSRLKERADMSMTWGLRVRLASVAADCGFLPLRE